MDGTLLTSRRVMSRATAAAMRQAAASGVHVAFCTGRSYRSAYVHAWFGRFRPYVVSANGAMAHDRDGRLLFCTGMDDAVAREVTQILRHYGLPFHMYTAGAVVTEAAAPWKSPHPFSIADLLQPAGAVLKVVNRLVNRPLIVGDTLGYLSQHGPCVKYFCPEGEPGSLKACLAEIRASGLPLDISASGADNFELTAFGVNKGAGLARLAEHLGVARAEVVAVGDHLNDVDMIRWAGLGVAMANAVPAVKELAGHMTASNDADGVAKLIHTFILNQG